MKAVRGIVIAGIVIVLLAVAAVFFLLSNLDSIVEAAIEKYGSQATQTDVRVASVKITLAEGEGAIAGLTVGNPPGFSAPNIFALGKIGTKIDVQSVTQDPVVIDEIYVGAPQVYYEIDEAGKSNLDALKQNMAGTGTAQPAAPAEAKEGEAGPKLIIRRLVIEEGNVEAKIAALPKQDLSTKLPRIELKDLGAKQGGATPDEIAEEIVAVLVKRVGTAVAQIGVEKYLGKSVDQLKQDLKGEAGKRIDEELGDRLGGGLRDRLGK